MTREPGVSAGLHSRDKDSGPSGVIFDQVAVVLPCKWLNKNYTKQHGNTDMHMREAHAPGAALATSAGVRGATCT